ncbi:MAG: lysophospholipid acyltransferase family protein [Bdellovibrionota bacterium]
MSNLFKKSKEKLLELKDLPKETLLYRVMPKFLMELIRKYLRLEIEGLEHIPKKGRALLIPNHSGYSGFDALLLGHEISHRAKRIPRVLTHRLWFITEKTSIPAHKLGFFEATTKNGLDLLGRNNLVVLFPEGEKGNFKATKHRYRLQEFRRGFVRMALQTQSPIIPVLIIGAEETHINLKQLKFTKYLIGSALPLPLNIIPLPAKWKIKFLEPIHLPFKPEAANDTDLVHEIASDIQDRMQEELNKELAKRDYVFVDKIY